MYKFVSSILSKLMLDISEILGYNLYRSREKGT
jgi:hypothetical protein